jgi:sec-independent protein translocase protein TatC
MLEDIRPHLDELRKRLIYVVVTLFIAFMLCFSIWEILMSWITYPLKLALAKNSHIIATKMGEQFFAAMMVSFFTALIISLPVIFYQLWAFVAPGLYDSEKKLVIPFVASATLMFVMGAGFAYYVVFPVGFEYLVNFGTGIVQAMISIDEYLDFFIKLMIAFGLSFELPVITFLLAKMGLVTDQSLVRFFRVAIVLIFVFAAIITPPDVMSQIFMAIPMIGLYGISILVARVVNPERVEKIDV